MGGGPEGVGGRCFTHISSLRAQRGNPEWRRAALTCASPMRAEILLQKGDQRSLYQRLPNQRNECQQAGNSKQYQGRTRRPLSGLPILAPDKPPGCKHHSHRCNPQPWRCALQPCQGSTRAGKRGGWQSQGQDATRRATQHRCRGCHCCGNACGRFMAAVLSGGFYRDRHRLSSCCLHPHDPSIAQAGSVVARRWCVQ